MYIVRLVMYFDGLLKLFYKDLVNDNVLFVFCTFYCIKYCIVFWLVFIMVNFIVRL